MKLSGRAITLFIFVVFLGFMTNLFFPKIQEKTEQLFHVIKPSATPTPLWQEQEMTLSPEEKATMSGNFMGEFSDVLATSSSSMPPSKNETNNTTSSSPTPTSNSASQDSIPPTVTITGGPNENETVALSRVCFPLWVSDNATNYAKLLIRTKLDTNPWTEWEENLSPCMSVEPGSHTFTVQAKDATGNLSPETQRHFVTK